jgi:hypothetical protein
MKRASAIALVAILACSVLAVGQGMPAPTPAPELKKLDYFVGTWKSEGELKPGSMGPGSQGGKFSEVTHSNWMAGRFFLVENTTASGVMGHLVEVAYLGYDSQTKNYTYDAFNNLGEAEHSKGTVEGDTWTWTSTENMGGQPMKGRFTITVTSPTAYSFKFEIAPASGGDYSTIVEGKATKVVSKTTKGAEGAATRK